MSTYSLSLDSRGLGDSVVKFSNTSAATITYLGKIGRAHV